MSDESCGYKLLKAVIVVLDAIDTCRADVDIDLSELQELCWQLREELEEYIDASS